MTTPITDVEKQQFENLTGLMDGRFTNVEAALMRCTIDVGFGGEDVAVVVAIENEEGEDGLVQTYPVAILVTPDILDMLTPPVEVANG